MIRAHNGQVIHCPTIEIQWLPQENTSLNLFEGTDKIIFISANAVQGFLATPCYQAYRQAQENAQATQKPLIELYAIGRATQQKGIAHHLPLTVLAQTNFDSEHLLNHPVMQSVQQQTVMIVKGQGGRKLLETRLQARGAKVVLLEVYRRVSAPFCSQGWQHFIVSQKPVLLITSLESFNRLLENLVAQDACYADLGGPKWHFLKQTIVFSARIKVHLQTHGWNRPIHVVSSQSNDGIMQTVLANIV